MPPSTKPKTLRQAKKDFKRYSPQVSPTSQKRYERAIELEKRAEAARQRDARKREAMRRREENERREREARRQHRIGLATQLAGYSGTQIRMKSGMEAFLGYGKRTPFAMPEDLEPSEGGQQVGGFLEPDLQFSTVLEKIDPAAGVLEDMDDMFASGTQLARELDMPSKPAGGIAMTTEMMALQTSAYDQPDDQTVGNMDAASIPKTPGSNTQQSRFQQLGLSTPEVYEAFADDELASEDLSPRNQSVMPPPLPPAFKLPPVHFPSGLGTTGLSLHDLGLSTQILNEAFDDPCDVEPPKFNRSSSFGLDGVLESSWEAAALSKLAEVEA
jgi:hypothetical protein